MIRRVYYKLLKIWWSVAVPIRLRALGVRLGNGVQFFGMPIVSMVPGSTIQIGDRVVLCSDSRFTALGVNHPVVLRTLRKGAEIFIDKDTGISGGSICSAVSVRIGNECMFGANVTIADTDFHAIKPDKRRFNNNQDDIAFSPVIIGDNVFIGTGAIVLKGVAIGNNTVIGGSSVVIKSIAENLIAAGNPARTIRAL